MNAPKKSSRVAHVCPLCGCIRHLRPADAAKTQNCRHCHCARIAPLGFAATAERWGQDFAIRAAAAWRIAHPSSLERRVEAALSEIEGIVWQREYAVERPGCNPYFVDFVVMVGTKCIALEVNGCYVHRNDCEEQRKCALQPYFDEVVIISEGEVKRTTNLTAYLQTRLAQSGFDHLQ